MYAERALPPISEIITRISTNQATFESQKKLYEVPGMIFLGVISGMKVINPAAAGPSRHTPAAWGGQLAPPLLLR